MRIGAAAQLGRQQGDPVAEALPPDIGPGVDDLAHDVVALRFGVVGAGVAQAVVRHRSAAQGVVAEHRGLGDAGGADGDVATWCAGSCRGSSRAAPAAPALALRASASFFSAR